MIFPRLLAIFQKRFAGDDALLALAQRSFARAALGPEFYAENVAELAHLFRFRPAGELPVMVHLSRSIDLFSDQSQRLLFDFAALCREQVYGFVVHDQPGLETWPLEYAAHLRALDRGLRSAGQTPPYLFIEYAIGIAPERFCDFFETIRDLPQVSACLDIGHLGIWQANRHFRGRHPGRGIFGLTPASPELPELIADMQEALESALPVVIKSTKRLAELGKPLHFHLHDGHPLAACASPFGVSDHLSFFTRIVLPFSFRDQQTLRPMFGPAGLASIMAVARADLSPELLSCTLEIHPPAGRSDLAEDAHLFAHWRDKTNAERMKHWLDVLLKNLRLLRWVLRESISENS